MCTGCGWDGLNFLHSNLYVFCFGFVPQTVLIAHQCSSWTPYAQCQDFLFPSLPPVGRGLPRTLEERETPHNSCSAIKDRVKEKEGELFCCCCCFQSGHSLETRWQLACLCEMVNDFLCVDFFFFPPPLSFTYLSCPNFDPWIFLLFLFPISPGVSESKCTSVWVLSCWPGSTHHKELSRASRAYLCLETGELKLKPFFQRSCHYTGTTS